MEEVINPFPTQPKRNKISPTAVVVAVLIVAVIASYLIITQSKKTETKKDVVVQKQEPTPTEKPKVEKSLVKIQVLNGTGTPGQAGVAVKALTGAGYAAENIKTGNADKFDNTKTTIEAKVNFEGTVKDIEDALKSDFDNITVESSTLSSDSEFDIVVITGGKVFETATPSSAPTTSTTPTLTPTTGPSSTPTLTPTLTPTPTP